MATIRSRIRPYLYRASTFSAAFCIYAIIACMILVIIIATSFYWIPLTVALWIEEKPVLQGLLDWFVGDVLSSKDHARVF